MRHQFSNTRFFQMALFTLFSSLLSVGIIGVTSAQAEVLTGTTKGKVYCDEGGASIIKDKFKEGIQIDVDITQEFQTLPVQLLSPQLAQPFREMELD